MFIYITIYKYIYVSIKVGSVQVGSVRFKPGQIGSDRKHGDDDGDGDDGDDDDGDDDGDDVALPPPFFFCDRCYRRLCLCLCPDWIVGLPP